MSQAELFDIKKMSYSPDENPMNTDGFAFLEFSSPDPEAMANKLKSLGFTVVAKHHSLPITLFRQGTINFFLNDTENTQAASHHQTHGAAACAMGFKVQDAKDVFERCVALGAKAFEGESPYADAPAIYGIGGTLIYFIDDKLAHTIHSDTFPYLPGVDQKPTGVGLEILDHLTHNVYQGNMDAWADFYGNLFNFREIRFFDIDGKYTGLTSRALTSACGKIKIPLNQTKEGQKSQIEEFLDEFNGEGIQHIALTANNIYENIETLKNNGVNFLDTPDTYYELISKRELKHSEDLDWMQKLRILIDADPGSPDHILLQIFTENFFGPVFFEIIQRKGNDGFGEGNFQALFDSIELDQIRRGVVKEDPSA